MKQYELMNALLADGVFSNKATPYELSQSAGKLIFPIGRLAIQNAAGNLCYVNTDMMPLINDYLVQDKFIRVLNWEESAEVGQVIEAVLATKIDDVMGEPIECESMIDDGGYLCLKFNDSLEFKLEDAEEIFIIVLTHNDK